jgi:DNA-binding beta-propeller fold protein YncE
VIALPAGFEDPRGIASQTRGDTIFVTAREITTTRAVILAIPKSGSGGSVIVTGAAFGTSRAMTNPIALALSPDEGTLYIVDISSSFTEAASGAILRVPASGGTPVVLSAGAIDAPSGVVVTQDGTLFVTGADPSDGRGAVFTVSPTNGVVTLIAKGGLLTYPTGLGATQGGDIFVADSGQRRSRARLLSVASNQGTTSLVGTIDESTEVHTGVLASDGTVRVAARRGTAGRIVSIAQSSGLETGAVEGPPLVAPNGLARDGDAVLIADAYATGRGALIRSER